MEKECRNKLFKAILSEYLNNNIAASGYLGRKIKLSRVNVIDLFSIYESNKRSLEKVKTFNNENYIGAINYIFKVLESIAENL